MLPGRKEVCWLLLGWEHLWCFFPFLFLSSPYSAFSMSSPEQTRVSDSSMWWESQGGHFSLRMTAFTHWIVHEGPFPRPWSHSPSPSLPFHAVLYSGHGVTFQCPLPLHSGNSTLPHRRRCCPLSPSPSSSD